ncbi:hypothetical protein ACJBUE_18400 (plasmid) [Ralstonia syzygii subsp. celebesensis]|uniref:hypothetical protein n=1 Tax=Ralstonia syzygii TaxID=28097 RepID=UPI00387E1D51
MNALHPLGGCALVGLRGAPASSFEAVVSSLRYQSTVLGMPMIDVASQRPLPLSFMRFPDASPIVCSAAWLAEQRRARFTTGRLHGPVHSRCQSAQARSASAVSSGQPTMQALAAPAWTAP